MSDYADRLQLARSAWRRALPSEAESLVHGRRVQRAMLRTARGGARRRVTTLVAAALVLIAALAYASSANRNEPGWDAPRAPAARVGLTVAAEEESERAGTALRARRATDVDGAVSPPPPTDRDGRTERSTSSPEIRLRSAEGRKHRARKAPARAGWADVSRALDRGDEEAAEQTLRQLEQNGDVSKRAKARLGLAKLALARDDRAEAMRLANEVARTPGIGEVLRRRARTLAARAAE